MSNLLNNITTNIRNLLQFNNLSNEEFAVLMNFTTDDVERLLSGDLLLPPRVLNRIADVFKITYTELLSEDLQLNRGIYKHMNKMREHSDGMEKLCDDKEK